MVVWGVWLAVHHMRFMHHVSNCSWQITVHAQCAVISQREATQAFTWDKKQQQQQLVLRSGRYEAVVTYVLIEGISCVVVGYFGVYGSLALLRTPQKCFCLVTDSSEVLLWKGKEL